MSYPKTIVLDYSARGLMKTVPVTRVSYFREILCGTEGINTFSERKINHRVSNLADASRRHQYMNIREVIHRSQLGEFGFTEVPVNQIW